MVEQWLNKLELRRRAPGPLQSYGRGGGRRGGGRGSAGMGVAVCALRSFYEFIGSEAGRRLDAPRVTPGVQRTLSYAEAERVITSIDTAGIEGKRDLALIAL